MNPKDCSALKVLAEVCHQVVSFYNKECQVNFCEKQFKEKDDVIQELKRCLELSTERELNATNVKRNQSKLRFYTGFTNTELFNCCFDFDMFEEVDHPG